MNREILFKAKRKDNGKWVEGYYLNVAKINHFICTGKIKLDGAVKGIIAPEMYAINATTLCQYTGLTDKNGKKIWENDICEMVYDGVVNTYVIVWDKDELDFKGTNGKEDYGGNFEYLGCCEEIITLGNIFDNPELLEVK